MSPVPRLGPVRTWPGLSLHPRQPVRGTPHSSFRLFHFPAQLQSCAPNLCLWPVQTWPGLPSSHRKVCNVHSFLLWQLCGETNLRCRSHSRHITSPCKGGSPFRAVCRCVASMRCTRGPSHSAPATWRSARRDTSVWRPGHAARPWSAASAWSVCWRSSRYNSYTLYPIP